MKSLLDDAILEKFKGMRHGFFEETDESHGRRQTRRVWVTNEANWLGEEVLSAWSGLASVAVVESVRQDLGDTSGKVATERCYYISIHNAVDAAHMAEGIRGHWGVENSLHWGLDVQMEEDQSRLREKHGAENFSHLRRIALNKLKRWEIRKPNGKIMQAGLHLKQQSCGWSRKFLLEALLA